MPPAKKVTHAAATVEGVYVNYFKVGYNADVFVFDQYQIFGEDHSNCTEEFISACPRLRMIASPMDAKQWLKQLEASIGEYEKFHGTIPMAETPPPKKR